MIINYHKSHLAYISNLLSCPTIEVCSQCNGLIIGLVLLHTTDWVFVETIEMNSGHLYSKQNKPDSISGNEDI